MPRGEHRDVASVADLVVGRLYWVNSNRGTAGFYGRYKGPAHDVDGSFMYYEFDLGNGHTGWVGHSYGMRGDWEAMEVIEAPRRLLDMAEHTPGPWTTRPRFPKDTRSPIEILAENGNTSPALVAVAHQSWEPGTDEANAHLIAAAPDLLDALDLVVDWFSLGTPEFVEKYGAGKTSRDVVDRVRQATARARGEGGAARGR